MRRFEILKTLVFFIATSFACAVQAQADPIPKLVAQFASANVQVRESAFESFLTIGQNLLSAPSSSTNVKDKVAAVLASYPNDIVVVSNGLIRLLRTETSNIAQPLDPVPVDSVDELETPYSEYYANLVVAVVSLNDPNSLQALLPLLNSGNMVINAVVAFGQISIDPVLAKIYSQGAAVRDGATFALLKMLDPPYNLYFNDSKSLSKIRAGLRLSAERAGDPFMEAQASSGVSRLPMLLDGDLNADGIVDCRDLSFVAGRLGTKVGQSGFDIRADIDGSGVVNRQDLKMEEKYVAAALGLEFEEDDIFERCHIRLKRREQDKRS